METKSAYKIASEIAENLGISKKLAKAIVKEVFQNIQDTIVSGGAVTIQGFGRFCQRTAEGRTYRTIRTNELREVGRRNLPKVKFAKNFINRVKNT